MKNPMIFFGIINISNLLYKLDHLEILYSPRKVECLQLGTEGVYQCEHMFCYSS